MRKLVLFMHTSLDGFVGGPKGEIDWIKVDAEMFQYAGQQTNEADMALYGRVTYEMMQQYWPTAGTQPGATQHDIEHARWYNAVNKGVFSKSMKDLKLPKTTIISESAPEKIAALKSSPGRNMLMFGSPTAAHVLMESDLIDEYWVFLNPVLLGQGIPFFQRIKETSALSLRSSHAFSSGVVGLNYLRQRGGA